jgi:putative restriction endonuclease
MLSQFPTDNLDRDWRIRLAAFDHIRRIRDEAHRVTWAVLQQGFDFEGETIYFVSQQGIFKPRQLSIALAIRTTPPSPDGPRPYDDRVDPNEDLVQYRYRGDDRGKSDNEAMRRAGEARRPLIWFYGLSKGVYQAEFPVWVVDDDPATESFHLAIEDDSTSAERLVSGGLPPLKKAYATTLAKRRLHQGRFREMVLGAYRQQCTVCTIGVKGTHTSPAAGKRLLQLLDAAHILADRDEQGRPEVPNGLSLCKIHHSAYDLNILGISPDRIVHIREDILNEVDGPMLQHGIKEMSGRLLHLPKRAEDHPNREYLALRYEEFIAA